MNFKAISNKGIIHKFQAENLKDAKKYIDIVLSPTQKWELQENDYKKSKINFSKKKIEFIHKKSRNDVGFNGSKKVCEKKKV